MLETVSDEEFSCAIVLFKYFQSQMKKHGKNISFPKNVNVKKTYLWRHIFKFYEDTKNFNLSTKYQIIESIVDNAASTGKIKAGASILNRKDIYIIAEQFISDKNQRINKIVDIIKRDKEFINSNGGVNSLEFQEHLGGFSNITKWYLQASLSIYYLVFSKSARFAIAKLNQKEKTLVPSIFKLNTELSKLLADQAIVNKIRPIIGTDFQEINNAYKDTEQQADRT